MARLAGTFELTLLALCERYLRPGELRGDPDAGLYTVAFVPPLSQAEQATFAELQTMARFGINNDLTLAEFQTIKADITGLVTYQNLASPTLAQTVLAVKAQSRILRALLRN